MSIIKRKYRIVLIDEENNSLGIIELEGYDLSKTMARGDIINEIVEKIENAERQKELTKANN